MTEDMRAVVFSGGETPETPPPTSVYFGEWFVFLLTVQPDPSLPLEMLQSILRINN